MQSNQPVGALYLASRLGLQLDPGTTTLRTATAAVRVLVQDVIQRLWTVNSALQLRITTGISLI
jgi:hypothetical protein